MTRILIAEDEAVLRREFINEFAVIWPEAQLVAEVGDGEAALEAFEATHPEVAFLDVKMPGLSGVEVARVIAGQCHVVFITAHEDAAVAAFETGAIDYVLKPVTRERLCQTIDRIKGRLGAAYDWQTMLLRLSQVQQPQKLRWLQASTGRGIEIVNVDDVAFFKAEDKYTTVATRDGRDLLIRLSLKDLLPQLESELFWRIHRSSIVNIACVERVVRDDSDVVVWVKGRPERLSVSRAYRGRFRHL